MDNYKETPVWKEGVAKPLLPRLEHNLNTDVVIIGGGLTGILTAYLLAKSGQKAVVLEKDKIGSGVTEYTTAFITQAIDTSMDELIRLFGEEKARLVWQSGGDAIDLIERIVNEETIECEFMRTKVRVFASEPEQYQALVDEERAESNFGFDVTKTSEHGRVNFSNFGSYEINNQAKFHPLKFLLALAEKTRALGAVIYEQSEVKKIKHHELSVTIETADHAVEARYVVVATYQPFHNRIRLFLKRGMYRSYVLALKLPQNLIKEGLYWDKDNPYHYFRIDRLGDYDRMILGGEDVKTIFKIDPEKSFEALKEYFSQILPGVRLDLITQWTGPILEPSDGLALIGQTFDRELVATAFSGNGMTYGAISAMILTDKVLGNENIYAEVYDPKRIHQRC
jgi:glycine/D-amino acid oxidase-like deaminating enzyme